VEFLLSDESFYTENIDKLVTVYKSHETDEIVGWRLRKFTNFVRDFIKNAPGFRTEIEDERIKVEHLFTAMIWAADEGPHAARTISYRTLREVARENQLVTEVPDLAGCA
jgi:hypothetical protein